MDKDSAGKERICELFLGSLKMFRSDRFLLGYLKSEHVDYRGGNVDQN